MFVDSHCHLDRLKLSPYDECLDSAIEAARANDVSEMLCVSIDMNNVGRVIQIAEDYDDIYASVGVHPTSYDGDEPDLDKLVSLADHPKVIAIGETGLDYYYDQDHVELQKKRFATHLEASSRTLKPTIVHTRSAKEDTLALISQHGDSSVGGVLHCFTEDWDMASRALDLNYYISFSGIVTFKNATELQEVAKKVPLERMLIETDSPYLAPVPFRGKSNEPKYVPHVAKFIADLKGVSCEEIAEVTKNNFHQLFRLDK